MTRRLRIAHLVVQPVLVWDDGEEIEPGPPVQPVTVPLSKLAQLQDAFPAEVAALADKLTEPSEEPDLGPHVTR